MAAYLKDAIHPTATPQKEPIPGKAQVVNSAGGYVFAVAPLMSVRRFLILGSEGGSYYASERKLTLDNLDRVKAAIATEGLEVVKMVVEISESGRAPKNGPALLALALCTTAPQTQVRQAAYAAIPRVARIGTHLFEFTEYVEHLRGWGRGIKQGVARWYLEKEIGSLAIQAIKYRQREGVSHADVLRRTHPKTGDPLRNALFAYMVDGWPSIGPQPHEQAELQIVWAAERAQQDISEPELVRLITDFRLPMEAVPTEKRSKAVYEALLPHTGLTWLLRNLGNLAKTGAIAEGQYSNLNLVCDRLTNLQALKQGRIHPLSALVALNTYQSGKGVRGSGEWPVIGKIVDALNAAFYLAFKAIEPTGKRFVLGIDVSGSMAGPNIAGMPGITPRVGSAAMAMTTLRSEESVAIMAFSHSLVPVGLSKSNSLWDVIRTFERIPMGGTDCALPMLWAAHNRVAADTFVVYTDSETWAGAIHPCQALRQYREKMGIPARLVVCGMTANQFTLADPEDAGMLDMIGFSSDSPAIISEFAAERI